MEYKKEIWEEYEHPYIAVIHVDKTLEKFKKYVKRAKQEKATFYISPVFEEKYDKFGELAEKIMITVKNVYTVKHAMMQISHIVTFYDIGASAYQKIEY